MQDRRFATELAKDDKDPPASSVTVLQDVGPVQNRHVSISICMHIYRADAEHVD